MTEVRAGAVTRKGVHSHLRGIAQTVGAQGALVFAAVITGAIAVGLLVSFRRYGVEGW